MLAKIIIPICGIILIIGFVVIRQTLSGLSDWINRFESHTEDQRHE